MSHDYTAGRIVGSLPPPPGQTANFVNPPNHDVSIIALQTTCQVLVILFVAMRVYVRGLVLHQFGWDDAFCVAAWMFSAAYSAVTLKDMTLGLGRHLWDIPAIQAVQFGKWLFILDIVSTPVWLTVKLAFFWSYVRVFAPSNIMRWLCYGGALACTALYIAQIFHDIFICVPVQKDYNPKLPGHCLPSGVGGSVTAIFNVITDLYILILPLPFVWSLHMKLYPKLRLMALFGLGVFVNAASVTRLAITYQIAKDKDVSWKLYKISLWATLEMDIALIIVCALVLPSFWKRVLVSSWSNLSSKVSSLRKIPSTNPADPERGLKLVHVEGKTSPSGTELKTPSLP